MKSNVYSIFRRTLLSSVIATAICGTAIANSPPNLSTDILWQDSGGIGNNAGFGGVADIAQAFNNARRQEEIQLGLAANTIANLVMPSQAQWDVMSDDAKALYLLNDERTSRAGMQAGVLGLPFAGIESSIDAIAKNYAQLLHDTDTTGHYQPSGNFSVDGPARRIEQDPIIGSLHRGNIVYGTFPALHGSDDSAHYYGDTKDGEAACHEFITRTENLAYYGGSSVIPLPIERSIYSWIYADADSSWGHREAALLQDETLAQQGSGWGFTNNNGTNNHEGYLGFHRINSTEYQPFGSSFSQGSVVVMNIFDPVSDADAISRNCTYTVSLRTEDLPIPTANEAPTATTDTVTTAYETASAAINVLINDTDPENDTLSVTANTAPSNGSVVKTGNTFVYTPNDGFSGSDSFSYTLSDGTNTATGTVNITVGAAPNQAPIAVNDSVTIPYQRTSKIDVLANDSDPENDTLTFSVKTPPEHGLVQLVKLPTGESFFLYSPVGEYSGADSFEYTLSDGTNTATGTVNITLSAAPNQAPTATTDTVTTVYETASAAINVLINDTDPENDTLSVTANTAPSNGSVVKTGDTFVYTPNDDFSGSDSFSYTLSDGTNTATGTVNITVGAAPNQAPTATTDTVTTVYETASAAINVLINDTDPENDTLFVTANTAPSNGSVVKTGNTFVYTPNDGFSGSDSFTYTLSDGTNTATGTVNITVGAAPNQAPDLVLSKTSLSIDSTAGDTTIYNWITSASDGEGGVQYPYGIGDTTQDNLKFNVTSNSNPALFDEQPWISNPSHSLHLTPKLDAGGSAKVCMTVTDLNGTGLTSAEQCFTITVNQIVNNSPSFTLQNPAVYTADASDGEINVAGWVVEALDGEGGKQLPFDGSNTADKIRFNITSNSNPGLFTSLPYISFPSQALHFETNAGTSGTAQVCAIAVDRNGSGLSSAEQCFTINITDSSATTGGNTGSESGSENSSGGGSSESGSESGSEGTSGSESGSEGTSGSESGSEGTSESGGSASGVDSNELENGGNTGTSVDTNSQDNLNISNDTSTDTETATKGGGSFSSWLMLLLVGLGLFRRRK